jgi:6-phosphogluconate dehydrogenase
MTTSQIGLIGLAVMGQNLALNIAQKGFPISVWNRSPDKVDSTVARANEEGPFPLTGFHDLKEFIASLERPRRIILLVKAGKPVDDTLAQVFPLLEAGDIVIDGGNEWYQNTERRAKQAADLGLLYVGMGVSGGEEGARRGPSMMPGGAKEAWPHLEAILRKVAAQVDDGPCVTWIGPGGAGNYVKMIHNGIEYGDMQLIAEAYDILKHVGGLCNQELKAVFQEWNEGELESFLIEITSKILARKDDQGEGYLVDKILDKTGSKGTGMWTVQEAAALGIAAPTMATALDARYISSLKDQRVAASALYTHDAAMPAVDKAQLIEDVRQALYCSKVCSYAQGMNLIRAASEARGWGVDLGSTAQIWKGGCIIRARFLGRIKAAYDRDAQLPSLLVDGEFARELGERQAAWRRVVSLSIQAGITAPGFAGSLAYFDSYRRARLPANLIQGQRDFFGAHTYERTDMAGSFHTEW